MKEEDVIDLVQLYRHNLLNQLQVLSGYIQLKNMDKVEKQMREFFNDFNEERKLFSLNIPHVCLWILQFSSSYKNYHLSYEIDLENKNLQQHDASILNLLEKIMHEIEKIRKSDMVIDLEIAFRDAIDYCIVEISMDKNNLEETIKQSDLETIHFQLLNEIATFEFKVIYS